MKNKEKKLLKRNMIVFLLIIALYFAGQLLCRTVLGNEFRDYLFGAGWLESYNTYEPEQIRIEIDPQGIVQLGEVTKEDGRFHYSLQPLKKGKTYMTVSDVQTGETLFMTVLKVSATGTITDGDTGNFTNYRAYHLLIIFLCVALAIYLWISFFTVQKTLVFSYQSIFYVGLAIWMTLISVLQIRLWCKEEIMVNVYGNIRTAADNFILFTFLPMLIFCIALSVSNVSLIRHEGFRSRNALGILLSVLMLLGAFAYFGLDMLFNQGSEMQLRVFSAFRSIYGSIYVILECFLMGSILCGTLAARHEPEYDMDYVVILGCKVRPDGTLYPLIRGRVDRAIAFYKKQLAKTGKKLTFLPSGGQGSDETISEAEAMKRYLLEQGIPEEQILVEDQSKNTVQNMVFSKKLIEERKPQAKAAFSTTNFHVFRSGIISRQNDFEPDGMGSPTKWYFWPNAYMREVVGMMAYKKKSLILMMIPVVIFFFAIQFV